MGKMPIKKFFVDRYILDRSDGFTRLPLQNSVDQQQRIAMRQVLFYLVDVETIHCHFREAI